MSSYNEGARGRARYWMERAQRAEAELREIMNTPPDNRPVPNRMSHNERKAWEIIDEMKGQAHEALATPPPETSQVQRGVVQGPNGPTWYEKPASAREGEPTLMETARREGKLAGNAELAEFWGNAPHTPEQADYLVEQIKSMPEWAADKIRGLMRGEDAAVSRNTEQAHGDALAALDRLKDMAMSPSRWSEDPVSRDVQMIRRHLTASGVPYEIRQLPDHLDGLSVKYGRNLMPEAANAFHDAANEARDFIKRAIAAAPTDGRDE